MQFTCKIVFLLCLCFTTSTFADSSLAAAIRGENLNAVINELAAGENPNQLSNRITLLSIAAIRGNLPIVRELIKAGADPDKLSLSGANTLSMAVRSCRAGKELIQVLLESGADIENRSGAGITPLMVAVQEKRTDIALLLLTSGADVNTLNKFEEGVLNYAIYVKSPILINAILEHGVDTAQLENLFTTIDYDPPGIKNTPSHLEELCS